MRIGFVIGSYPEPSETFVSRKVEFLLAQGHEVVVFQMISRTGKQNSMATNPAIVSLQRNGRGRPRCALSVLHAFISAPVSTVRICARARNKRYPGSGRLDRLIRYLQIAKRKIDVLHVHFAGNLIPILGVRDVAGIPAVVSLLGSDVTSADRARIPAYLQLIPPESEELIAACGYLRDEFVRRTRTRAEIHILPPEVPCAAFEREREECGTPCRLFTVARLHWKKGLLYAVHAAHELRRRGLPFTYDIVGEGDERPALEKAIEDLGLQQTVHLLGMKNPSEMPKYYRRADIFVLPSVNEGAGGVLMEAQAAGVPIVASQIGGIPEAVQEGKTGRLVPPRDPVALADAIEELIREPQLRLELGRNGRVNARRFDTAVIGSRLVEIYRSAIEKQASKGACDAVSKQPAVAEEEKRETHSVCS